MLILNGDTDVAVDCYVVFNLEFIGSHHFNNFNINALMKPQIWSPYIDETLTPKFWASLVALLLRLLKWWASTTFRSNTT